MCCHQGGQGLLLREGCDQRCDQQQVLSLLALPVQKYKYCCSSDTRHGSRDGRNDSASNDSGRNDTKTEARHTYFISHKTAAAAGIKGLYVGDILLVNARLPPASSSAAPPSPAPAAGGGGAAGALS